MYIATQLLKRGDREGINAFLHEHPADLAWPAEREEIAALADDEPGAIVASRIDLEPGGNTVRAYLDILAPNRTTLATIEAAVAALRDDLSERQNPTVFGWGAVVMRFGVDTSLASLRELQLDNLSRMGLDVARPHLKE